MKTLKDTKPGETVTLVKYHDTGDVDLRRIEMSVKGYDVCLRKEEAENIEVE